MKIKLSIILLSFILVCCTTNDNSEEIIIPTITEISNSSVEIGDIITLDGANFSEDINEYKIKFNDVEAEIISLTSTQIKVKVPNNITSGSITLIIKNKEIVNIGEYTIIDIISKWYLNKSSYNGVNNELSECEKQNYIQFSSNGTFERKQYFSDGPNCIADGADSGTYSYDAANHKIELNFNDPDEGSQIEKLNNVNLTTNSLKYSWDEDGDGIDEIEVTYNK